MRDVSMCMEQGRVFDVYDTSFSLCDTVSRSLHGRTFVNSV